MALLLRGITDCPLCGNVIEDADEAVLFPPFVLNEIDPLYPLSDTACHRSCLSACPLGPPMLAAVDVLLAGTGPGKRLCAVCGVEARDPDDYLWIGYLGDVSTEPLGRFNYTHLHASHISDWELRDEFLALAKATIDRGRWRGKTLSKLVEAVEAGQA